MKESCAKAVGIGLRIPFNTLEFENHRNYFTWEDAKKRFLSVDTFLIMSIQRFSQVQTVRMQRYVLSVLWSPDLIAVNQNWK